jgi:hypothetical protein
MDSSDDSSNAITYVIIFIFIIIFLIVIIILVRAARASNVTYLIQNVATQGYLAARRMTISGITADYVVGDGSPTAIESVWNFVANPTSGTVAIFNVLLKRYITFSGDTNNELIIINADTADTASYFSVLTNTCTVATKTFQDPADTQFVLSVSSTVVTNEELLVLLDLGTSTPGDDEKFVITMIKVT